MVPTPPVFTITKTAASSPAPRARRMNAQEWYQRAIDLAFSQHLAGTLRFRGIIDGDIIYTASSASNPLMEHKLHINIERQWLSCDCAAHQHHLPCGHLGAAFLILRQITQSALPSNLEGQRQYEWWSRMLYDAS